jgi:hypothetical protein
MHKQVIDNALILAYNEPARVEVINLPASIELAKREMRVVKMSCILSDQVFACADDLRMTRSSACTACMRLRLTSSSTQASPTPCSM